MTDLLPASLAALGAVVGLIVGATLGGLLVPIGSSDVPAMVVGGLAGAIALAWTGVRASRRFNKSTDSEPGQP